MRITTGLVSLALLVSGLAIADERVFVRVETADRAALEQLDLGAATIESYGSFQWLKVDPSRLSALDIRGLRYRIDQNAKFVQMGTQRFDPLGPRIAIAPHPPRLNSQGQGLFWLQLNAPSRQSTVELLESSGLAVLQYYPSNAYLVWAKPEAIQSASALAQVRAVESFDDGFKPQVGLAGISAGTVQVQVFFYNDGNAASVRAALAALNASETDFGPAQPDQRFFNLTVTIPANQLAQVYALPQVIAVSRIFDPQIDDEGANQVLAQNTAAGIPLPGFRSYLDSVGLSGQGVTWAVADSGADVDHPDLADAYIGGWPATICAGQTRAGDDVGGHGSHVAGAIVGRGIGDGSGPAVEVDQRGMRFGQGMAPSANLFTVSFIGLPGGCPGTSDSERTRIPLQAGAVGSNNSWNNSGSAPQTSYLSSERLYDVLVRDGDFNTAANQQFSIFFSAGNAGGGGNPGTLTGPHVAKNPVIVGSSSLRSGTAAAVNTFNNTETMVGSSSRGPAADGRLLPTITAPGGSTTSTRRAEGGSCASAIPGTASVNSAGAATAALYAPCNGTSMSTPVASGAAVLLTEWWKNANAGSNPSPAMVKALLINGARDMAGVSNANNSGFLPIPNNDEGWGMVNMRGMVDPSVRGVYRDQSQVLSNTGEEVTLTVGRASRGPMRITLVWSDAPGAVGANPALVNDLDLQVVNGGTTYLGNVFSAAWSIVGGDPDRLNNMESVYLSAAAAGPTTIRIRATALNGDALSGNGTPSLPQQDFALVCTNCEESTFTLASSATRVGVCAPTVGQFAVDVGSLQGFTSPVALSVTPGFSGGPTLSIVPNSVTPGGSASVQMSTTAQPVGVFPFTINASSGGTTRTLNGSFFASALLAGNARVRHPLNTTGNVGVLPTFTWYAAERARSYQIQIASDAGFSAPLLDQVLEGTSFTPGTPLPGNANLFWRVRALNPCGSASFTAATAFSTGAGVCASNIAIPDNDNVTGVVSSVSLSGAGILDGLDVSLDVAHTRVNDLRFVLRQLSSNREFRLITRPNLCDGDNIQATLSDQASANVSCTSATPTLSGRLIPHDSLASLNGTAMAGAYELRAFDAATGDTGTINSWCVLPTVKAEVIFADGFAN